MLLLLPVASDLVEQDQKHKQVQQQQQPNVKTNTANKETKELKVGRGIVKLKRVVKFAAATKFRSMVACNDLKMVIAVLNDGNHICLNLETLSLMNSNIIANKNKIKHGEYIISNFKYPDYRFAIASKKNVYLFKWDTMIINLCLLVIFQLVI